MILMSHPTGNANVHQAALALQEAGLLSEFWTCLAPRADDWWVRHLPKRLSTQLLRRSLPAALRSRTLTVPARETARLLSGALGCRALTRHETGVFSVDAVYRELDNRVNRRVTAYPSSELRGVYAYEDGALETFRAARKRGAQCLYDLPIGYWRVWKDLLAEERQREPAWEATLQGATDSDEKLARKDEELLLAERIFVASSFTRRTLEAAPNASADIHVIPYGSPTVSPMEPSLNEHGPLRVLFAGALSQRKGLSYLFDAVARLGRQVELTLIGTKPAAPCPPLEEALRKHRWIPSLPHEAVLQEMRRHDVLAFPSLFEGYGLVIVEAMSQGLAVITTPNTAGPDVIEEGQTGFIVPIRSAELLAERLELLADDRGMLREMRHAAWRAAARLHWADYRKRLATAATEALGSTQLREEIA